MDNLTASQRSKNMSRIRAKNSKPECELRQSLYKLGFRYRKNVAHLPGKPDLVFKKYNTIIFVNGCFWHQHPECQKATLPKSNKEYWHKKLRRNIERDKANIEKLENLGWKVLVIWECEINKNLESVVAFIHSEMKEDTSN